MSAEKEQEALGMAGRAEPGQRWGRGWMQGAVRAHRGFQRMETCSVFTGHQGLYMCYPHWGVCTGPAASPASEASRALACGRLL